MCEYYHRKPPSKWRDKSSAQVINVHFTAADGIVHYKQRILGQPGKALEFQDGRSMTAIQ